MAHRPPARPLLDNHQVELPIVKPRPRRDAGAVPELRGVRDRDENGFRNPTAAAGGNRVGRRDVAPQRASDDRDIPGQPAAVTAFGELGGHVGVEAEPRDVHKQMGVDFADVDRARLRMNRVSDRALGTPVDLQLAGKSIARPGRHHSERHLLERQRRRDFVERAVTAPRDDQPRAFGHRGPGQFASVTTALRHEHSGRLAVHLRDGGRELGPRPRLIRRGTAGHRIDDDRDRHCRAGD